MTHTRPIWAEISRHRLLHNYRFLHQLAAPEAELMTVVKADAYGHGLADCARILAAAGANLFGVTSVEEAVALRRILTNAGHPSASILAMSGCWRGEADAALEHRITPSVWDPAHLDALADAAARQGYGAGEVPIHLEIDTGMSRQGVQPQNIPALVAALGPASSLRVEAAMTHFHSPADPHATGEQIRSLVAALDVLAARNIRPPWLSAGSSADLLDQSTAAVTDLARTHGARRMFRTGLALYGYAPNGQSHPDLQPVLAWKTRIVFLRDIPAGAVAGYGATFRAERPTRLALIAVGYADGLSRALSNQGAVLIRGHRAPIAGRVSMDQTIVDVTGIPGVSVGDEAVLIGEQGSEAQAEPITAAGIATLTGTIAYEVLCNISARVPRVVVE
jgi:alanine racemase